MFPRFSNMQDIPNVSVQISCKNFTNKGCVGVQVVDGKNVRNFHAIPQTQEVQEVPQTQEVQQSRTSNPPNPSNPSNDRKSLFIPVDESPQDQHSHTSNPPNDQKSERKTLLIPAGTVVGHSFTTNDPKKAKEFLEQPKPGVSVVGKEDEDVVIDGVVGYCLTYHN